MARRTVPLMHAARSPFPNGYRSDRVRLPWPPGEARDVKPGLAEYLVSTFPEVFLVVRDETEGGNVSTPPPATGGSVADQVGGSEPPTSGSVDPVPGDAPPGAGADPDAPPPVEAAAHNVAEVLVPARVG